MSERESRICAGNIGWQNNEMQLPTPTRQVNVPDHTLLSNPRTIMPPQFKVGDHVSWNSGAGHVSGHRFRDPCACRYAELGLASCCSRFAGVVIATAQLVAIAQPALHAYGVDDSCHIRAVLFRFQPPGSLSIHAASCAFPP